MPLAAARRPNAAGIERVGDHAKGREPGSLDRPDNRQDIGRKLIGRGTVRRVRLHGRLGRSRIAELGARSFLRCERSEFNAIGALRNMACGYPLPIFGKELFKLKPPRQ